MDSFATYFLDDVVDKQVKIEYEGRALTNEELHSEEFELTERLCSENQLRFGSCEAATLTFKISNVVIPLKGKWLTVMDTLEKNTAEPFLFGKYKVDSDKPTADRRYRDIIAYDAMYDIINAEVSAWYNTILPDKDSKVTLKQFRDSFCAHFGIEQEEVTLVNDSMVVERTIDPDKLSGKTVAACICEINGCFGHIGRDGKFHYIHLKEMVEGLYPSDTLYPREDLYPADPMNAEQISGGHYIRAEYEDFVTAKIDKLQIRQEEDDIGCIYGTGDNCYIVQDNFLVYGKSHKELTVIAGNMFSVISKVWYRPAHVEAKGNPCLEVGDGIRLCTRDEIIYTYILQRTLKGIQALRDTYEAEGEQRQSEKVNSVQESIIQLKGRTNVLKRTIEETRLTMTDIERNLQAQITINADGIKTKVSKDSVISEINQSAEKITIKAGRIDLVGLVEAEELTSKFATITTLNATKAELDTLISKKATIAQLNVQKARIDTIAANYISASTVEAKYATIDSLNAVNVKVSGKLEASQFTAENISAMNITVKSANVTGGFSASKITSGTINTDRLDVTSIQSRFSASESVNCSAVITKGVVINDLKFIPQNVIINGSQRTILATTV